MKRINAAVNIVGHPAVVRHGMALCFQLNQLCEKHTVGNSECRIKTLKERITQIDYPFAINGLTFPEINFVQAVIRQFYLSEAAEFQKIPVPLVDNQTDYGSVPEELEFFNDCRIAVIIHQSFYGQ